MAKVHLICFFASYLVAFVLELTRMLGQNRFSRFVMLGFGGAGFVAHTLYLLARSRASGLPPLLSSPHDWMLVLAWLLVLFYLFLTALHREIALGLFMLPLVLALIAATRFMAVSPEPHFNARNAWTMLHASLLVFGMAGVVLGLIAGLMYLTQHHRLKSSHAAQFGWKMPSLERLAQFNRWSVMIAFPLLTLGFGIGVYLVVRPQQGPGHIGFNDPVVVASSVLWGLLAVLFLWLLKHHHPSGRQVAWLTICAFAFLLIAVVGLQVLSGSGLFHTETHTATGEAKHRLLSRQESPA